MFSGKQEKAVVAKDMEIKSPGQPETLPVVAPDVSELPTTEMGSIDHCNQ